MQPHAPITRTSTHSSTEPTHGPPALERRDREMKSWSAHGKGAGGERISTTTNPAPAPETATEEKVQKLNGATTIKVTTHHGRTPHRSACVSIEPSYSRSTTWPTTLPRKPSQTINKQSQVAEKLEEKAQAEKPKSRRNKEEWNRGGEDYIFRVIDIIPGTPHTRPLHHLYPQLPSELPY